MIMNQIIRIERISIISFIKMDVPINNEYIYITNIYVFYHSSYDIIELYIAVIKFVILLPTYVLVCKVIVQQLLPTYLKPCMVYIQVLIQIVRILLSKIAEIAIADVLIHTPTELLVAIACLYIDALMLCNNLLLVEDNQWPVACSPNHNNESILIATFDMASWTLEVI